jgi:twinkle protein
MIYNDTPVNPIADIAALTRDYHNVAGEMVGIPSGLPGTENHWRLVKGQLTVITGIPGAGKSEIMDQVMVDSVAKHGWRWLVLSPENLPLELHSAKLVEKSLALPFGKNAGFRMTADDAYNECKNLGDMIRLIQPDETTTLDLDWMLDTAKKAYEDLPFDGFLFDPWSEAEWRRPRGMSEHEYAGQVLTTFRRWARSKNISVHIVAHPKKMQKLPDDSRSDYAGQYPPPTPYDISGSSHFRNAADVCISMWRRYTDDQGNADTSGIVECHVQKMRNRLAGQIGKVVLHWSPKTGRYYRTAEDKHQCELAARAMAEAAAKVEVF